MKIGITINWKNRVKYYIKDGVQSVELLHKVTLPSVKYARMLEEMYLRLFKRWSAAQHNREHEIKFGGFTETLFPDKHDYVDFVVKPLFKRLKEKLAAVKKNEALQKKVIWGERELMKQVVLQKDAYEANTENEQPATKRVKKTA